MTPKERLENLGWVYNESLNMWSNSNRYVEIDGLYVDINAYKDGEFFPSYLSIEEFILFSKLMEEGNKYECE